ncbi:MAG TPA: gluconate 2-dehydrogenase subunit 3 family protein [Gemmatimonadaceae bacterium]|nr:gluconate 2-dehydrogenase subunit 3 family protein [Gemmatimonadaceae bacterium]
MSDVSRRDALKLFAAAPLVGALDWSAPSLERATRMVARLHEEGEQAAYKPKFFTAHEWRTVRVLADMIIPRDERSGSATDAKAPEFIDFMLMDKETSESSRVSMRGGLAWLDTEMRHRFTKDFLAASDVQRRAVLDDIAFPKTAKPEFRAGVAWFNRFRSNVGSAFFSSAMGWQDLRYIGNVFNPSWNGCPPEATRKLGVSYEEFDASLARSRKA